MHPSQPMSPETHLRSLATDLIEVKMRKPIDLGSDTAAENVEVDQIGCFGPVIMNDAPAIIVEFPPSHRLQLAICRSNN